MIAFEIAGRTDVGHARSRNEDSWDVRRDRGLVAVADGMGGHPSGDVASRLAVEAALRFLSDEGSSGNPPTVEIEGDDRGEAMAEAVRTANREVLEDGAEHPERAGMGTTLTVLEVRGDEEAYCVGHVGDSRAYLLRDGSLRPLTRDHTPLQEKVDAGEMTREEARRHPLSHVLTQALGTGPGVEPQVVRGEARPGDLFLLCSDGLTAVLGEAEIEEILRGSADEALDLVAEDLVEETLEGGAPDNVTVALLRVRKG